MFLVDDEGLKVILSASTGLWQMAIVILSKVNNKGAVGETP